MKMQWRVFVGFLLVLLIVVFAVLNNTIVPISFGFTTLKAPLILVLICSAIIGALIVLLTSTATMWQQKKKIEQQEKELAIFKEEMDKKVAEEKEKIQRDFTNQTAKLEASYQTQIKEQELLIASLSGEKYTKEEKNLDYFD
ncbi:hypothetical protein BAU15_15175 [Enterococcus sp. JM4C]|uniref:LapA family protein n=1 Tax=Candidatus Enterococcus huntleyi TaxID=1857217 RepID=UPI001379AA3A|nr:hypothetical protein BAU15_15175 [Enterococcus sp. JM4C]